MSRHQVTNLLWFWGNSMSPTLEHNEMDFGLHSSSLHTQIDGENVERIELARPEWIRKNTSISIDTACYPVLLPLIMFLAWFDVSSYGDNSSFKRFSQTPVVWRNFRGPIYNFLMNWIVAIFHMRSLDVSICFSKRWQVFCSIKSEYPAGHTDICVWCLLVYREGWVKIESLAESHYRFFYCMVMQPEAPLILPYILAII